MRLFRLALENNTKCRAHLQSEQPAAVDLRVRLPLPIPNPQAYSAWAPCFPPQGGPHLSVTSRLSFRFDMTLCVMLSRLYSHTSGL